MPTQGEPLFSRASIPQLERVVPAAREQARAVGRERNRVDLFEVPLEGAEQLSAGGAPQSLDLVADITEGLLPQVGRVEPVAQQVITVEFNQRVHIEKPFDR